MDLIIFHYKFNITYSFFLDNKQTKKKLSEDIILSQGKNWKKIQTNTAI